MSAYFVLHNVVTDPALMEEYVPKAVETLKTFGAEILVVSDETRVLEGTLDYPRTVILKFASREAAMAWYESPEYQKALPLRLNASQGFAVMVDGLDGEGL